jgi:hypothetical protein
MSSGSLDFTHDKISVAIRLSSQEPARDVVCTDICSEWVDPVCSPEYLKALQIRTPADLQRAGRNGSDAMTRPSGN